MLEQEYDRNFFDKEYFNSKDKSNYSKEFWDYEKKKGGLNSMVVEFKELFNPTSLLDVGCARGLQVKAFCDGGIDAYGIDISDYAIKESLIKEKCSQCDITLDRIPFQDGKFDLVLCKDILEHLPFKSHNHVFYELTRVTSKYLVLIMPFLVTPEQIYGGNLPPKDDISHISLMPTDYYQISLLSFGMSLVHKQQTPGCNPWDMIMVFEKNDWQN
jgi:SAM-dependent methyltransferase